MKVVIATPLYPPDIAEPAPYVKELAKRLTPAHQVTILAYGTHPERVSGVRIVAVNKRVPLPLRLAAYTKALLREAKGVDVVYAMNGASIELPLLLARPFMRARIVYGVTDAAAHEHATQHFFRHLLEQVARARARGIVDALPLPRPEVLPFQPEPVEATAAYERSWSAHLVLIESQFAHVA